MPYEPRRISITTKLVLYLVLMSIIPLLLLGMSSYQNARDTIRAQVSSSTEAIIAQHTAYIDRVFEEVESLIANVSGIDSVLQTLGRDAPADTYERLATQARIGDILSGYINLQGLRSIDIFAMNGAHYHIGTNVTTGRIHTEIKDRLLAEVEAAGRTVLWTGIEENFHVETGAPYIIVAAKAMRVSDARTLRERTLAYLLVSYDVAVFDRHLSRASLGPGASLYVADTKGRIVGHSDKTQIGTKMSPDLSSRMQGLRGSFVAHTGGVEMFVSFARSAASQWLVVGMIPVEQLTAPAASIRSTTLVVLALCFAVVLGLALSVSRSVVRPIRQITQAFQQIQAGTIDWAGRIHVRQRDEIGELLRWFNTFLDNLVKKRETERELLAAKEAAEAARAAAEAASQAKSQFLANINHELRTPLNGIMGMTELAIQGELAAEQREYLDAVKESAVHLLALVNDILDYTSLDTQAIVLCPQPFALRAALEPLVATAQQEAASKGLAFAARIDSDVPDHVIGDAGRLCKLFDSLLDNAVKFTNEGRIDLHVAVQDRTAARLELVFTVRDTGIGIAASELDTIFMPFTQVDASNTRRYGGAGMGLAIATRIARLMNGKVQVESEVGRGSTFRAKVDLSLPAESAATRWQATPALKILLVEDNAVNQTATLRLLEHRGHTVQVAENGQQAVEILTRADTRFDLVLMDLQMPIMGGLEAVAAIRAKERDSGGHIPIIAVTSYTQTFERERCLQAGMDAYVSKPLQMNNLLQALAEVGITKQARGSA